MWHWHNGELFVVCKSLHSILFILQFEVGLKLRFVIHGSTMSLYYLWTTAPGWHGRGGCADAQVETTEVLEAVNWCSREGRRYGKKTAPSGAMVLANRLQPCTKSLKHDQKLLALNLFDCDHPPHKSPISKSPARPSHGTRFYTPTFSLNVGTNQKPKVTKQPSPPIPLG